MVRSIRITQTGGPEVMQLVEKELAAPGPGFATVKNVAIGLNYIDTYHRSGLYPLELPSGLGLEAAGEIVAVGEGVALQPGTRVAYCSAGLGAYADAINLPAQRLIPLPDDIDCETAAAAMLKGQTVEYLIQRTYPLRAGEYCLFHAAAGGVGLIFGQWAKSIGALAIGTVSSAEKAELALAHGYTHVINYKEEGIVERVLEICGGQKLPVVYDGVGKDTFESSLDCLAPRGLMVSFGNASGPPPPLDLQLLTAKGSLFITRPTLMTYTASDSDLQSSAADTLSRIGDGSIRIEINQRYALEEVTKAHEDLESRRTTGSTLIIP